MSKRKLSCLVRAMQLYGEMDERDRSTLAEWIKSQTATPRRASKKTVSEQKCVTCGAGAGAPVHSPNNEDYHIFRASFKKKGAKNDVVLPDNPDEFHKAATG